MATDYSYDLEVSKDTKTATLTVRLPARGFARDPILEFDNKAAIRLLDSKGLGHLEIQNSPQTRLSNWSNGAREGVWTFGVEKTATNTVTTKPPVTNTTTTETTVSDTEVKAATTRRTRKKTTKTTK